MIKFKKYQALGNDYIVINPKDIPTKHILNIEYLCNRHYGIGSNGILLGPYPSKKADYKLQIFNPDGTEAEISGNGLRIFAQYLKDEQINKKNTFSIELMSKVVNGFYYQDTVMVNMGQVTFPSNKAELKIDNTILKYVLVDVGNPHCVVFHQKFDKECILKYGKNIEHHPLFPNKTNVQFIHIKDRINIEILIWERGAGYTLASGSSSIACAAAAYHLGLCDENITVHMPGGSLFISFDEQFNALMKGKSGKVFEGIL